MGSNRLQHPVLAAQRMSSEKTTKATEKKQKAAEKKTKSNGKCEFRAPKQRKV